MFLRLTRAEEMGSTKPCFYGRISLPERPKGLSLIKAIIIKVLLYIQLLFF